MAKIFCLCFLTATVAFGQSTDSLPGLNNNIHISTGILHTRQIDEGYTGSSLLFRRTNIAFRFGYGRETERQIIDVTSSFSIGKMKSKSGDLPSDFYYIEMNADYLRRVVSHDLFKTKNQLFAGIRLGTLNQGVANLHQLDNISVYSLHGAYIALHNRLKLDNKRSLMASWYIPSVVYENRILFNGGATDIATRDLRNVPGLLTTHGDFSYFSILRNIQLDLTYITKLSDGVEATLRYEFFYASSAIDAPFHAYSNELTVGLQFRF
jgi:hypothetical protein